MSRDWSGGSTRRWRRIRAGVLLGNRADNAGRCRLAVAGGVCTGVADRVHHMRGKAHGDDPRYLAASCGPCNGHVGDPYAHPAACPLCRHGLAGSSPRPRRVSRW